LIQGNQGLEDIKNNQKGVPQQLDEILKNITGLQTDVSELKANRKKIIAH